jgi:hypothetical protein
LTRRASDPEHKNIRRIVQRLRRSTPAANAIVQLIFSLRRNICYNFRVRSLWKGSFMKSFIIACVVAVVLAVIGGAVLNSVQVPADKAFSTVGVRLGA